jgi:hypothetical protein
LASHSICTSQDGLDVSGGLDEGGNTDGPVGSVEAGKRSVSAGQLLLPSTCPVRLDDIRESLSKGILLKKAFQRDFQEGLEKRCPVNKAKRSKSYGGSDRGATTTNSTNCAQTKQLEISSEHEKASEDFSVFSPRSYLQEYHCKWDDEDELHINFFHEAYGSINKQETMIEVSGGPILCQLISARNKVDSIVFTDFLPENLCEIRHWKEANKAAFNWDRYFKYILKLENGQFAKSVAEMKAQLREKLGRFEHSDVLTDNPPQYSPSQFDIVSSHFCAESITSKRDLFQKAVKNTVRLATPNGYLVMSFLKNARTYDVGDVAFAAYPVDEKEVIDLFKDLGFKTLLVRSINADDRRTYAGAFSILAQRVG